MMWILGHAAATMSYSAVILSIKIVLNLFKTKIKLCSWIKDSHLCSDGMCGDRELKSWIKREAGWCYPNQARWHFWCQPHQPFTVPVKHQKWWCHTKRINVDRLKIYYEFTLSLDSSCSFLGVDLASAVVNSFFFFQDVFLFLLQNLSFVLSCTNCVLFICWSFQESDITEGKICGAVRKDMIPLIYSIHAGLATSQC